MIAFVPVRSLEIHDCFREGEGVGGGGVRDCAYGRGGHVNGFWGVCGGEGGVSVGFFLGVGGEVESMSVAGGMGDCGGGFFGEEEGVRDCCQCGGCYRNNSL